MAQEAEPFDTGCLPPSFHQRFRVVDELGRGGTGIVLLAEQMRLQRLVAVKILSSHVASCPDVRARFVREARVAARLKHPAIVNLLDFGEAESLLYIVYEYIGGGSLSDVVLKSGKMPVNETVKLLSEIGEALDYAHGQGVVHRDIKPPNILMTEEGNPKIGDFGLAAITEEHEKLTKTGVLMGTPDYMAPEQVLGATVDTRTDLYALGVIAFLLLSGRRPYESSDVTEVLRVKVTKPAPRLRLVAPTVPPQVASVVNKALEREPEQRQSSVGEFVFELRAGLTAQGETREEATVLSGIATLPRPASKAPRATSWRMGVVLLSLITIGIVVALALGSSTGPSTVEAVSPRPTPVAVRPSLSCSNLRHLTGLLVKGAYREDLDNTLVLGLVQERLASLYSISAQWKMANERDAEKDLEALDKARAQATTIFHQHVTKLNTFRALARLEEAHQGLVTLVRSHDEALGARDLRQLYEGLSPLLYQQALHRRTPSLPPFAPDVASLLREAGLLVLTTDSPDDACRGGEPVASHPTPVRYDPLGMTTRDTFYDGPAPVAGAAYKKQVDKNPSASITRELWGSVSSEFHKKRFKSPQQQRKNPHTSAFFVDATKLASERFRRVGFRLKALNVRPDILLAIILHPQTPGVLPSPSFFVFGVFGADNGVADLLVSVPKELVHPGPSWCEIRSTRIGGSQEVDTITLNRFDVYLLEETARSHQTVSPG